MKRPITHEALRSLAWSCEHAKNERCKCRCGGALHGTPHPETWIAEQVIRDRIEHQRAPGQIDWVGFAGFERYL